MVGKRGAGLILGTFVCLSILGSVHSQPPEVEFPFCIWGISWIYQPDSVHEPAVAPAACKATCMAAMSTHFAITRMLTEEDVVHCNCGDYYSYAHEPEYCVLRCGPDNKFLCGGPDLEPIYMSVYSVCDPYDFFGPECRIPCPETCLVGCDRNSGECIYGCDPGYWDLMCSSPCPDNCTAGWCNDFGWCYSCDDGFYGEMCELPCPEHCAGDVCDFENGGCLEGCDPGWCGALCGTTCAAGDLRVLEWSDVGLDLESPETECGVSLPGWAIAVMVLMFFLGAALSALVLYCTCTPGRKDERPDPPPPHDKPVGHRNVGYSMDTEHKYY